jgi:hypothetical protein
MADGNYLTVIVLNVVIGLAMLGTPLIVRSVIGSGLAAMTSSLGPAVVTTMVIAPAKASALMQTGRQVLSNTAGFVRHHAARTGDAYYKNLQARQGPPPLTPEQRESHHRPETPPPIKK